VRGVVLHLEADLPAKPGAIGRGRLYVAKDRESIVIEHGTPTDDNRFHIADAILDCTDAWTPIKVALEPPSASGPVIETGGVVKQVLDAIAMREKLGDPFTSTAALAMAIKQRKQDVQQAVRWLMACQQIHHDDGAYVITPEPPEEEQHEYQGVVVPISGNHKAAKSSAAYRTVPGITDAGTGREPPKRVLTRKNARSVPGSPYRAGIGNRTLSPGPKRPVPGIGNRAEDEGP
jgi:hypothetical protein